jgi:hypothetical protein
MSYKYNPFSSIPACHVATLCRVHRLIPHVSPQVISREWRQACCSIQSITWHCKTINVQNYINGIKYSFYLTKHFNASFCNYELNCSLEQLTCMSSQNFLTRRPVYTQKVKTAFPLYGGMQIFLHGTQWVCFIHRPLSIVRVKCQLASVLCAYRWQVDGKMPRRVDKICPTV